MKRLAGTLVGFFALVLVATASRAQPPGPPPPPPPLDAAGRATVVHAAADMLRQRYVYPDVGAKTADALEAALAAGKYDALVEPWALANQLTADLQSTAHDKHLRVAARGPAPRPAAAPTAAPPTPAAAPGTAAPPAAPPPGPPPRSEAGVVRADRLPGNIGYLEIVAFPALDAFKPPIEKAMAALKDTRALIIDARRHGGGSPVPEAYLASYFLDPAKPVAVNRFVWRNAGTDTFRTEDFNSSPTPFRYAGKPVYVLTSSSTFSGGEAIAYDMQALGLAKVVGEVTGGGANPGGMVPLSPDYAMFLPAGRGENPTTGKNWDGVGVQPDVVAPAADALKVALGLLGEKTDKTTIDALSQARVFEPRSTPDPRSEAAIRRTIDELVRGEPNYELMTPGFQDVTRQQLPQLKQLFAGLGPIESMTFMEVGPQGGDTYNVKFASAAFIWSISLTADGKTAGAGVRPAGPPPGQ
jgi:hypothetical protein